VSGVPWWRAPATRNLVLAALAVPLAVLACSDLAIEPAINRIPTAIADPSFAGDIEPVLAQTCASSNACHSGPSPQANLRLDPGFAYGQLVGVPAASGGVLRVMPGFPDSSLFYLVLSEDPVTRRGYTRMPMTSGPLPVAIRETIRNWILNGAPEN
jgi:hypothetical protein